MNSGSSRLHLAQLSSAALLAPKDVRSEWYALTLLMTLCGSVFWDCLYSSRGAVHMPVHFLLAACVLGFRWAIVDQRRRCPVCLCLLTHPAQVGQPSRIFLGWNGTELMCSRGHGLLHVPENPTSWFSTQRWITLDPSWTNLFP